MRIIVTGHSEHGKDEVCNLLSPKLKFGGSSTTAAEEAVYPFLRDRYGYKTVEECFQDRRNHKHEWYELIKDYNDPDRTRLGRAIFSNNDVYCGLRSIEEYKCLKAAGLVDFMIWVDAGDRKPPHGTDCISITAEDCDVVLDNNGTKEELPAQVLSTFITLLKLQIERNAT